MKSVAVGTWRGRVVLSALICGALPLLPAQAADPRDADALEEVVVTGTHIHGADAAGSRPIIITRAQIDGSGYGRIEDVLARVTQNVNRANPAVQDGTEANNFFDRGAEVQLRGLGVGTTLVLVNGQRLGASGYQGSFSDVSNIPASAVERIEILPEGASALYGSDAIGGVVNIILRKDFEGIEGRARVSTAGGDATERTLAALWGHVGAAGRAMVGLQYEDSRALACSARVRCAAGGDFRSLGGTDLRAVGGNPGTILDPVTFEPVAAIPRGQDGTNLLPAQLITGGVNHADASLDSDILPSQRMRSAFFNASYELSRRWQLLLDGRYSAREFRSTFPQSSSEYLVPVESAFNHLGGPVLMAYDLTPDLGPVIDSGRTTATSLSTSLSGRLARGWQLRLYTAYSKASSDFVEGNLLNQEAVAAVLGSGDPATALNIFGDGSHSNPAVLAALRNQSYTYTALNEFTTVTATVIADGPLIAGPAGPIRIAVGADTRHEHSIGPNIADGPENRGRRAVASFIELAIPLVSAAADSSQDRLALSIAGRHDQYSDVGGSFNPKVGLNWRPLRALSVRGTWGTSFRAPPFLWSNPDQTGDAYVADVIDPKSTTGTTSRALLLIGSSGNLKPETSTSWTLGADLKPSAMPNVSLSVTYFDIDYKGQIRNVGVDSQDFLTQEAQLASLITRNPSAAQLDAACRGIVRFVPFSIGDCSDPITVIIDARFRNLARVRTRGVDVEADYALETARGKWAIGMNGTYTLVQQQQITPTAPVFDLVDTVGNPLRLRIATHLSWSSRQWTAMATLNHSGAYDDPASVPARGVDAWTSVDLNLGYSFEGGSSWLAGTRCNLGVNNLFDRAPSFVNRFDQPSGTLGYDPANGSLLGRQFSLQFVKQLAR